MNDDIRRVGEGTHAPPEVVRWAEKITKAQQCPSLLSREANGYHLYIPCPDCLHTHGRRELDDPKYSINLSMVARLGEFGDRDLPSYLPARMLQDMESESKKSFGSSVCMRTRSSASPHRYSVDDLIHMATVTERHPDILTKAAVSNSAGSAEREEHWEEDPVSGAMCPPPPGKVVPLDELPPGHPALEYLSTRGYDIGDLVEQFRCGFCTEQYPERQNGIYYRKMPGGWADTPQHRIIFCSLIDGAPMTWQARLVEKISEDGLERFMLHPYAGGGPMLTSDRDKVINSLRSQGYQDEVEVIIHNGEAWAYVWSKTHVRPNRASAWQPVPPFDELRDGTLRFQPSKYRTAKYSSRQMMGWDAAVARAQRDSDPQKWVVLCEGPLDAARVGPGGVALIGSSISIDNATKLAGTFNVAFSAFDADRAGRDATSKITKQLMSSQHRAPVMQAVLQMPIPDGKDLGDMTSEQFDKMLQRTQRKFKRGS